MKRRTKVILIILLIAIGGGIYYLIQAAKIATAYVAKMACSCTMVSHRPIEAVNKEDLSKYGFIKTVVNEDEQSVTASALGLVERKAIYRKGLGCTLVFGVAEADIRNQAKSEDLIKPVQTSHMAWPMGDSASTAYLPKEFDSLKFHQAIDEAFIEKDSANIKRSRAVLVIHKGKIIGEKYAEGISKDTPLLGWSMTKSVTNALVGILVGQNKLNISSQVPIEAWQRADDSRSKITLDQLLRMSSGLDFKEVYNVVSDATKMLFASPDAAAVAISQPLAGAPNSTWSYSSGTTNIISLIIKKSLNTTQTEYFNFPRKVLFNKIGMESAVIEPDPSGTFVGSSFMYATARDWARFGLLYLNDGMWQGERILPANWVKYCRTPSPNAPLGQYGAHFWLNAGEKPDGSNRKWPKLPKDVFQAIGFEGQNIVIIPSMDLIIVRLGNTQKRESWEIEDFAAKILETIKTPAAAAQIK